MSGTLEMLIFAEPSTISREVRDVEDRAVLQVDDPAHGGALEEEAHALAEDLVAAAPEIDALQVDRPGALT